MKDTIERQDAIDAVHKEFDGCLVWDESGETTANAVEEILDNVPSAQPESKYTVKELNVFLHCVSLRLLSLRSAQHWRYDEETEKKIDFLEQLYEKVREDINHERPD